MNHDPQGALMRVTKTFQIYSILATIAVLSTFAQISHADPTYFKNDPLREQMAEKFLNVFKSMGKEGAIAIIRDPGDASLKNLIEHPESFVGKSVDAHFKTSSIKGLEGYLTTDPRLGKDGTRLRELLAIRNRTQKQSEEAQTLEKELAAQDKLVQKYLKIEIPGSGSGSKEPLYSVLTIKNAEGKTAYYDPQTLEVQWKKDGEPIQNALKPVLQAREKLPTQEIKSVTGDLDLALLSAANPRQQGSFIQSTALGSVHPSAIPLIKSINDAFKTLAVRHGSDNHHSLIPLQGSMHVITQSKEGTKDGIKPVQTFNFDPEDSTKKTQVLKDFGEFLAKFSAKNPLIPIEIPTLEFQRQVLAENRHKMSEIERKAATTAMEQWPIVQKAFEAARETAISPKATQYRTTLLKQKTMPQLLPPTSSRGSKDFDSKRSVFEASEKLPLDSPQRDRRASSTYSDATPYSPTSPIGKKSSFERSEGSPPEGTEAFQKYMNSYLKAAAAKRVESQQGKIK